jgi:hypothetical protein
MAGQPPIENADYVPTLIRSDDDVKDGLGQWARWGKAERAIAHLPATDPPWQGGSLCGHARGGWHPLGRLSLWRGPWRRCMSCVKAALIDG